MSQQTTMAVVVPKFKTFVATLPSVNDLANASEETLRQLWAGLGYYARARNLKKGAQYVVEKLNGAFPKTYKEWLEIPGCGPYTASVIASICFGEPVPCVDGNVIRVTSRLLGLSDGVWTASGTQTIQSFVEKHISRVRPGDFNQAMMELGATVCRKQSPDCSMCPIQSRCEAYTRNIVELCPPNKPRKDAQSETICSVVFLTEQKNQKRVAIALRKIGFLAKTKGFALLRLKDNKDAALYEKLKGLRKASVSQTIGTFSHTITHHKLTGHALGVEVEPAQLNDASFLKLLEELGLSEVRWHDAKEIPKFLSSSLDLKAWKTFENHTSAEPVCLLF